MKGPLIIYGNVQLMTMKFRFSVMRLSNILLDSVVSGSVVTLAEGFFSANGASVPFT